MDFYIPSHLSKEKIESILKALPGSRNKDKLASAKQIITNNTYLLPPFGRVKFNHLIDWEDKRSRSFERLIHGFTFLGCLVEGYIQTKELIYIEKSVSLIKDWISKFSYEKHHSTMAFHDETTALRMQYLLRFYIVGRGKISKEDESMIHNEMEKTAYLLSSDGFHATNTNHGMFQDIALLLFGLYFSESNTDKYAGYIQMAVKRLNNYFVSTYTQEGVHKEQAPSYHMLIALHIKNLVTWMNEINPTISAVFQEILKKTETYSTYIIRPDGRLPQISDTEPNLVKDSGYSKLYDSDSFKYAVSAGKEGIAPTQTDVVFEKSGYAIFRDDWLKKEKATYVLFTAAYNANYHKHSDDLNVLIYSNGEIITEAGPNGYNYSDPLTKYAYSSFGHNTLIVDGEGLPRTDNKFDKVYIKNSKISETVSEVTGINERYKDVSHKRHVKFDKVEQVIQIRDNITSNEEHEYKILWHVANSVKVHIRDRYIEFYRNEKKIMELEIETTTKYDMRLITGQKKPYVQGWYFPSMEKNEQQVVIELTFYGRDVELLSHFRLSNFKLNERNPFAMEKVYQSSKNIRYHFEPATDHKLNDKLLIVFSAMGPINSFVYNYMRTIEDVGCNKLYILDDFGDQGAYYLAEKQDFSIESSVMSLIQYIMSKNNILHKDVISVGSSKGGFAALYFGIKGHFGNIIAGAPQSKVGDFTIDQAPHHNIANYISGNNNKASKLYLNSLLYRLLDQPTDTNTSIELFCGKADHHYKDHVFPFYETAKSKGFNVSLESMEGITHEELRTFFPKYLTYKVKSILGIEHKYEVEKIIVKKLLCTLIDGTIRVECTAVGENLIYAFYVYLNGIVVHKQHYIKNNTFEYTPIENGIYQVKVFIREKDEGTTITKISNKINVN